MTHLHILQRKGLFIIDMIDYKKMEKQVAAGVLPICYQTGRILLCRRGKKQSFPLQWATWGGSFEEKEDSSPKDCAKREFWEETRCAHDYFISKKPIHINDTNHIRYYLYAGMFDKEWIPDIDSEMEASGWGWFYLNDLPDNIIENLSTFLNKESRIVNNLIRKFQP